MHWGRMVEVEHGTIEIDQVNIRNIGLDTLRSHLALVPQDTTLFLGTLRENLSDCFHVFIFLIVF